MAPVATNDTAAAAAAAAAANPGDGKRYLESDALVCMEAGTPIKLTRSKVYLDLHALAADQAVVHMHASGICHTDLGIASGKLPGSMPAVLGHEGYGKVHYLPPTYKGDLKVGDAVLCGSTQCKSCDQCKLQRMCETFIPVQLMSLLPDFSGERQNELEAGGSGKKVRTGFFSQSSFARYSVCQAEALVRIDQGLPGHILCPIVCGVQTGFGTSVNTLWPFATRAREWSALPHWNEAAQGTDLDTRAKTYTGGAPDRTSIAVFGLGGVGFSAMVGAKLAGFTDVIAIDVNETRLALAKKHGATVCINSSGLSQEEFVKAVKDASPHPAKEGVLCAVEATGVPAVVDVAWQCIAPGGRLAQVGATPGDYDLKINVQNMLSFSRGYMGVLEGESISGVFPLYMVRLFQLGKLDFLRDLVKTYKPEQVEQALHDMHDGSVIKPVILWEEPEAH